MKGWRVVTGAAVAAGVFALSIRRTPAPPPHQNFGKGDCAGCHKDPPKYHTDHQWDINHGRTTLPVQDRCGTCHASSSCVACHSLAPATHTITFREPGFSGAGAERHILFGRSQPSSCLTCHHNFTEDCTKCHTVNEVQPWMDEGRKNLDRWRHILGAY